MSFPIHQNPNRERATRAPYNFVPLADEIVSEIPRPDRDIYHQDRYTGALQCMLKTETPFYTRAALKPDESKKMMEAKDKADFFYVDPETKLPVIPGSGIRGALRTLIEIITYSKPQPVMDRQLFFRSLDGTAISDAYAKRMVAGDRGGQGSYPKAKAGYMELVGHDYRIRPAQSLHGTQFFRIEDELAVYTIPELEQMRWYDNRAKKWKEDQNYKKNGWRRCPVWFRPVAPEFHEQSAQFYADVTEISVGDDSPGIGYIQGWLIASGWVPSKGKGKHRHWIIAPPLMDQDKFIDVLEDDVDAYKELNASLSQTIKNQQMSVLPEKAGELIPCFYTDWKDSDDNARIAFGHTAMFRLPYEYSPRDLLPYSKEQMQLTDLAESIFGWVDDRKGRAIAGRVSIGDAHIAKGFTGQAYLLKEGEESLTPLLSGPKATTFQHYLTQASDKKKELYHFQDQGDTTLRGHKLYWHKDDNLERSNYHTPKTPENEKQLTVMRPVDQGVPFEFDIRFENLAAEELGALLWVLSVVGDGKHCLKVGMAKPLGLGSVSLKSQLHLSGRSVRYKTLFDDNTDWQMRPKPFRSDPTAGKPAIAQLDALKTLLQSTAYVTVEDWTAFIDPFEKYIQAELGQNDREFAKLERVAMLLALLKWPGPNIQQTKYMQGPNNQRLNNEFRNRPVLPDPLWITEEWRQTESNYQRNKRTEPETPELERPANTVLAGAVTDFISEKPSESALPLPKHYPEKASLSEPVELSSLTEPYVGAYVKGVVISSSFMGLTIDLGVPGIIATLSIKDTDLSQEELQGEYPIGGSISVYVKDRRIRKNRGTVTLSLQPQQ